jgi:hypothetical protein
VDKGFEEFYEPEHFANMTLFILSESDDNKGTVDMVMTWLAAKMGEPWELCNV